MGIDASFELVLADGLRLAWLPAGRACRRGSSCASWTSRAGASGAVLALGVTACVGGVSAFQERSLLPVALAWFLSDSPVRRIAARGNPLHWKNFAMREGAAPWGFHSLRLPNGSPRRIAAAPPGFFLRATSPRPSPSWGSWGRRTGWSSAPTISRTPSTGASMRGPFGSSMSPCRRRSPRRPIRTRSRSPIPLGPPTRPLPSPPTTRATRTRRGPAWIASSGS